MDVTWTIIELAEHAAAALTADGSAQVSGRVRDLPNARLIRWYSTIGLVDPPLGRRGRTALYGPRHLLQLVAVKRRQAAGRSIAEIQLELAAATDATLERIAALPTDHVSAPQTDAPRQGTARPSTSGLRDDTSVQHADGTHAPDSTAPQAVERATSTGRHAKSSDSSRRPAETQSFTEETSRPVTAPRGATHPEGPANQRSELTTDEALTRETPDRAAADPGVPERSPGVGTAHEEHESSRGTFWRTRPDVAYRRDAVADSYGAAHPPLVQGVRLAPGLTLVLDVPVLNGDDLAAIANAARPLLDELHRRGLLPEEPVGTSPTSLPADPSRRFT